MKKQDVINHFGSVKAVADALGITVQSVYEWPEDIPLGRQYQIELLTKGKLKAAKKSAA